jgi:hypothetical protein
MPLGHSNTLEMNLSGWYDFRLKCILFLLNHNVTHYSSSFKEGANHFKNQLVDILLHSVLNIGAHT